MDATSVDGAEMSAVKQRIGNGHGFGGNDNRPAAPVHKFRPRPRPMPRYPLGPGPKMRGPRYKLPSPPLHHPIPGFGGGLQTLIGGLGAYGLQRYWEWKLGLQNPSSPGAFKLKLAPGYPVSRYCYSFKRLPGNPSAGFRKPGWSAIAYPTSGTCPEFHHVGQGVQFASGALPISKFEDYWPGILIAAGEKVNSSTYNTEHIWRIRGTYGHKSPLAVIPTVVMVPEAVPDVPIEIDSRVNPQPRRRPDLRPYEEPALEIHPQGNQEAAHKRVPPRRGDKEGKNFVLNSGLAKKVGDKLGKITEVKDALDAISDGLPDKLKPGYRYSKGLIGKAKYLLKHYDKIDWRKAAIAYGKAQATDAAIGKTNQALRDAIRNNPYWRSPRLPGRSQIPKF